jgi:hypothetical protein
MKHMNADNLERRLQGQPIRDVPAEWRSQILSTAAAAAGSTRDHHPGSVLTAFLRLRTQVVTLLWPSPKVWASLAAIWLLLAVANRALFNPAEPSVNSGAQPFAGSVAAWKEQARILAELMQPAEPPSTAASSSAKPRPRSQLTSRLRMS